MIAIYVSVSITHVDINTSQMHRGIATSQLSALFPVSRHGVGEVHGFEILRIEFRGAEPPFTLAAHFDF